MMDDTEASPTEPKKQPTEKLNATIQVLHDSSDETPSLVAYFPSGFDSTSHLRGGGSAESNVTFVDSSEPTSTDYYTYRLGVLDKEPQTHKIVIARDKANFQQISSHLCQQELEGRRVPRMVSGKTLPCFPPWDRASRAGGFIIDGFPTGLRPQEYYFHCMADRRGLVDTAVKTSCSGYLKRCLVKNLGCLKDSYDHTVRDANGSILQFHYGEDGIDIHKTSFVAKFDALLANHDILKEKYPNELCKSNSFITDLPSVLKDKTNEFVSDGCLSVSRSAKNELKPEDFVKSVKQKYFSSLAQPGEAAVVAAQSVGEPSTQMTLNIFRHSGRGQMNVSLGISRLQEILMTAATDIKNPIMTCPLWRGRSKVDATSLVEKLKKITVAEMIESMEVAVVPFAADNHQACSIYKLKMKLNRPELKFCSVKHCEEILRAVYLRELEDAIVNHLLLLSKISGIKNFTPDSRPKPSSGTDEDASGFASQHAEERNLDDDADDGDYGNDYYDLGFDGQKHKKQAPYEMDYEDGYIEERNKLELPAGVESDVNQANEVDICKGVDGTPGIAPEIVNPSKTKRSKKKAKSDDERKNKVKRTFVEANGLDFEVHFRFTDAPRVMLAQIALEVAKKVYLRGSGKIVSCQVITCKENQVIYRGEDPKRRQKIEAEEKDAIPALRTNGADFRAFWQMQDVLDIRCIYSNNIHMMLTTYGVEAARETIIMEMQNVFGSYGVSVDIRHLTLIADFMTHTGGYHPMNRHGGIAVSPYRLSVRCPLRKLRSHG